MVRGNWQKRVERTEARRQEAKQVKQKKQDRRLFKQHAQKLLQLLDKHVTSTGTSSRPLRLHIWTDTVTSNGPLLLLADAAESNGDEVGGGGGGGKKKKGRNRSNSNAGEASTPKKAHPNSKEAISSPMPDEEDQAPLACMSHFFHDKCSSSGGNSKKGNSGCRYEHYFSPFKTLASVVKDQEALGMAKSAAIESIPDDILETEPNSMEMLNYTLVDIKERPTVNNTDAEESSSSTALLSDDVVSELSRNDIKIANIVYVAMNEILIYDRFREGVILSEREFLYAVLGHDELGKRRISVGSEEDVAGTLNKLPGSILEHTLTYLPDSAVTACSSVCRDWHNEIGQASPNLWRHLLERRSWPLPEGPDQSQEVFRKTFIEHYTAVRDMNAVKLAMSALTTRKIQPEREMCYQDFATRKQSPRPPNFCVSVQIWSPKLILVAYVQDCSLRLFEAVPKSGDEKLCKELVYQRIDPYKNTKRRRCTLVSMVLDEECIGSLCQVNTEGQVGDDSEDTEKHMLVVINREEFLLGESSAVADKGGYSEDLNLNIIDIGEATINYLLSTDTADHRQLQLMDFLQDGGEISEIQVLTSKKLVACGYGRFMVEVSISIPSENEVEDELMAGPPMRLIDRKLVIFSASVGAIVWVNDSADPTSLFQPRIEEMTTMTSQRHTRPGDYRPTCNFLLASPTSPDLRLGSVDPSGSVNNPFLLEASLLVRDEILNDGWEPLHRLVALTESLAIAADVLAKDFGEGVRERKSILSFYPLQPHDGDGAIMYHTLELCKVQILRLVILRDNSHIGLVCREYGDFIQVDAAEGVQMAIVPQSACLIIIHLASRKEIYRRPAGVENFEDDSLDVPIFSVWNGSTVGLALSWCGVAITGDDVRHMVDTSNNKLNKLETNQSNSTKKKKKKQGGTAKGRKKDGFARGMSLRG